MTISPITLANRFGYGVRPLMRLATSPAQLLASLQSTDPMAARFARPSALERIALSRDVRIASRDLRSGVAGAEALHKEKSDMSDAWVLADVQTIIARGALSEHAFRERLVAFWRDHFTVGGRNAAATLANGAFINEAIRPNLGGRFVDILKASSTHVAMLLYLDQNISVGPNSSAGINRARGLNENLAREILELHTLGVDGDYTQSDVRQFAGLLTGLQVSERGMIYNRNAAEPGSMTILGETYGGGPPDISRIMAFLDDLAVHPDTARNIATKLAVHFVSETPDPNLVAALTRAFRRTGGDLMAVYKVLLEHPSAANPARLKVKWPLEYVTSTLRTLDLGEVVLQTTQSEFRYSILHPLQSMGQSLLKPPGPDGWSEFAKDWITPPALTARIEWAASIAEKYAQDTDPRRLLASTLGDVSPALQLAVTGAESKWEGVALLLVSPEFNRR